MWTRLEGVIDDNVLDALLQRAEEQGHLTTADILEIWPEAAEDLDTAYEMIEEEGIELDYETVNMADAELMPSHRVDFEGIDSDDSISLYFREVGTIDLLDADQEIELAKRIEKGREAAQVLDDGARREQVSGRARTELEHLVQDGDLAKQELTQANSRLVISMAKRYLGQGVPFLDLIQEGNLGLMRAVEKFDWRRGNKFSTYATWWIRQSLTRGLADQGRTIRVPVHMNDRIRKVYAVAHALETELGRRPTPEEIAHELDMDITKVELALKASRRSISLEKPVGHEGESEPRAVHRGRGQRGPAGVGVAGPAAGRCRGRAAGADGPRAARARAALRLARAPGLHAQGGREDLRPHARAGPSDREGGAAQAAPADAGADAEGLSELGRRSRTRGSSDPPTGGSLSGDPPVSFGGRS